MLVQLSECVGWTLQYRRRLRVESAAKDRNLVCNGMFSCDQNTIVASITDEGDLGNLDVNLPGGELTSEWLPRSDPRRRGPFPLNGHRSRNR